MDDPQIGSQILLYILKLVSLETILLLNFEWNENSSSFNAYLIVEFNPQGKQNFSLSWFVWVAYIHSMSRGLITQFCFVEYYIKYFIKWAFAYIILWYQRLQVLPVLAFFVLYQKQDIFHARYSVSKLDSWLKNVYR